MAIEINGKIYRNVKGGEEGIFIDGEPIGGGNVTDLYLEIAGEEPTQEQLEQIYTQKPDVLRLGMSGGQHVIVLHKSLQSDEETRLNYFNVQTSEGVVQVVKIEYSEEDGYISDHYEWLLDSLVSGTSDGTNWTSLTIGDETHGIPQGGGTQLYKHKITIHENYQGDISTETLIFITKSEASLVGKEIYEINDFIIGYFVYNASTEDEDMCLIASKKAHANELCYVHGGNIETNTEFDGAVLTDTVTKL